MKLEREYSDDIYRKWKEYNRYGIMEYDLKFVDGKVIGKEYFDNGNIRYEGEFAGHIWNGNGKENFHNGKLLFSGEYLDGKKWTGKGYDNKYGYIQFELKEGKGKVREYNYDGELIFKGQYYKGRRHGYGIKYPEGEGAYYRSGFTYIKESVNSLDAADYIDSD